MSQIQPQIHLHNLTYTIPHTQVAFKQLTHSFTQQRIGLIGDNGVGKTTLLQLITGAIIPTEGSIQRLGTIEYCPQTYAAHPQHTLVNILGIDVKLQALQRILTGSTQLEDYEILKEDWGIAERTSKLLEKFGLINVSLNHLFVQLSGGQQTRLLLIKAMLSEADFILLDEPTNNLDTSARNSLYKFIQETSKGLIIVSHDRYLLEQMHQIIEITSKGLHCYGGNYTHYQKQKELQSLAWQQQLSDAKKTIKKAEQSAQQSLEKLEQRRAKGRKEFRLGKTDKLTANSKKGRSERTQAKLATQEVRLINHASAMITNAKEKIEIKNDIDANLAATYLPNSKMVLLIEHLSFKYPEAEGYLFKNFSLQISGPERIALIGDNGSGKTTLINLIMKKLLPCIGKIKLGIQYVSYLDQQLSLLHPEKTLLDNFQYYNPHVNLTQAHQALANFLFRNQQTDKLAKYLSGGERIRAALACTLMSKYPPQLLILDEPTNHLDIRSIQAIESALSKYQGAMLVISHDYYFLENISIKKWVTL